MRVKKNRYGYYKILPYLFRVVLLPDRQHQLFQPFHFRHALPGLVFAAFLASAQKAASFANASLLKDFFIPLHLPSC
jgi:hypothetical protein